MWLRRSGLRVGRSESTPSDQAHPNPIEFNRELLAKARKVAKEIGTTPGGVVRLMFVQMVKRRAIPFPLQADSPEEEILSPAKRRAQLWDEL